MDVDIDLLGGFGVSVGGAAVEPAEWRRRQAAALVKILALAPRRSLHREQVIDLLWPALTVDEAAPRLHKAAHYARRALGDPASLVLAGDAVALFPGRQVHVDSVQFQSLAEAALSAKDPGAAGIAADHYGGELLPQDPYEPWTQDTRERLRLLYLDVLRLAGRWEALTSADPTDEEAHLRLIAALDRRGDRRAALRQFERLERALRQELGVAPSRTAAKLRAQLLADDPAAAGLITTAAQEPDQAPVVSGGRPATPTAASTTVGGAAAIPSTPLLVRRRRPGAGQSTARHRGRRNWANPVRQWPGGGR